MNLKSLKRFLVLGIALILLSAIQSCDDNDDKTARVQLKLVDAPGDYLKVNVEIIDVLYNVTDSDEGWQSFAEPDGGYPPQVDLTELIAGNSLLLADEIIPAGVLKQIRLVLGENNTLLIDGEAEEVDLDTPSAMQSGLKLNLNEALQPGYSYTFILDWNVQESVVKAGNSGKYNLKPVIRVNAEVNSGAIEGKVAEMTGDVEVAMENVLVGIYTADAVLVTETLTDVDGNFLFRGLDAGTYTLKINKEGYQEYSEEISVVVGETASPAGTIILIPIP